MENMEELKDLCHSLPPREIIKVLAEAEANGIEIPETVSKWMSKEIIINFDDFFNKRISKPPDRTKASSNQWEAYKKINKTEQWMVTEK